MRAVPPKIGIPVKACNIAGILGNLLPA